MRRLLLLLRGETVAGCAEDWSGSVPIAPMLAPPHRRSRRTQVGRTGQCFVEHWRLQDADIGCGPNAQGAEFGFNAQDFDLKFATISLKTSAVRGGLIFYFPDTSINTLECR
jgi:hypothetical protein